MTRHFPSVERHIRMLVRSSPTPTSTVEPISKEPASWVDVQLAHWTEDLFWATLALAVATAALVLITWWITRTDRAEAEKRLAEERAEIDRRVQFERQAADDRATKQRQIEAAAALLQRIADLEPFVPVIPKLDEQDRQTPGSFGARVYEDTRDAVANLKKGALSEALALHNRVATQLYQALVQLHLDAVLGRWRRITRDITPAREELVRTNLSRYARHVRLCLRYLIDTGDIPVNALGPDGQLDVPLLAGADPDSTPWKPAAWTAPGWDEDIQMDHYDPDYLLEDLRRQS
jgi:hypothetical protein